MFRVNSCILWVHIKIPFIIIETINTVGSALLVFSNILTEMEETKAAKVL